MKIVRLISFSLIAICLITCGKKSDPIPKDALFIPSPEGVDINLTDQGIVIKNISDNYTLFVDKILIANSLFPKFRYERVALILPTNEYLDIDVNLGMEYLYRFYNYYPEYQTFSRPITRTIRYHIPVKINDVNIELSGDSLCILTSLMSNIDYVDISINGKSVNKYRSGRYCVNLPPTIIVDITMLPYDKEGYSGIPYTKKFERDPEESIFPPQNIKVIQNNDQIILSWDRMKSINSYNIYRIIDDNYKLLMKTEATLYSFIRTGNEDCLDFAIKSVRYGIESEPTIVSVCK